MLSFWELHGSTVLRGRFRGCFHSTSSRLGASSARHGFARMERLQRPTLGAVSYTHLNIEGAFSIVMMTRDRIFAARDPRGFRPLSMGRIKNAEGPDTIVFASETCAFDLLRAEYRCV